MSIHNRPHYRIPSRELATWLRDANPRSWWSVDGDPLLTALLDFPCPTEELALQLDQVNRDLLVESLPNDEDAHGQAVSASDLGRIVHTTPSSLAQDAADSQTLSLCWLGTVDEWVLVEDVASAPEIARARAARPTV